MNIFYHLLNRGVDKRSIFSDDEDRFKFIHDLYEFNDKEWANNGLYYFNKYKNMDIQCPLIHKRRERNTRKLLVDIHAFSLMPNHYHLLVSPLVENGIPTFMQKLNMGYAKYFNRKYKRVGTLFEGRYKSIIIKNGAHLIHLPYYIHLNPLDMFAPEWRRRKINNLQQTIKKLESYRWSSHLDYLGKKNFPSVTNRKFLLKMFSGEKEYRKSVYEWLKNLEIDESLQIIAMEQLMDIQCPLI